MGIKTDKGQVVIELIVCALLIVAMFLIAITLSETILHEQKKDRFPERKGSSWTSKR